MPEQSNIMLHGGNVWQSGSPDEWLDFSANLRPEGMPEWIKDILLKSISEAQYYPDTAQQAAISGIAAYLDVPPQCVLPFAGGIAAIDMVCRTAKGRVIAEKVSFGEYARRAAAYGLPVTARSETAAFLPGDTVFLCNPNNPTGSVVSKEMALALYETLHSVGARLCVDEAFIDFCPALTLRHVAAIKKGLIIVGSMTKILCVPGVRLGYLVAEPETIRALRPLCAPWGLNSFAVAIARALPEHGKEIQADACRNTDRREKLAGALRALQANVLPSSANFLLADFGRPMAKAVEHLKKRGILVRECASFGLPGSYLRFAVKTDEQNARLIAALQEALCAENA